MKRFNELMQMRSKDGGAHTMNDVILGIDLGTTFLRWQWWINSVSPASCPMLMGPQRLRRTFL